MAKKGKARRIRCGLCGRKVIHRKLLPEYDEWRVWACLKCYADNEWAQGPEGDKDA